MKEKLSIKVLKKDFDVKQHGYHVEQVDKYLDEIASDIKDLEDEIEKLKNFKKDLESQIDDLKDKNFKLNVENTRIQSKANININGADYQNVEVIQRLSKLETAVNNILKMLENKTNLG